MNRSKFAEYSERRRDERAGVFIIERQDETHFTLNHHPYELLVNHKDAFQVDALADRFSTVLSKYDYIVGDWGVDQLRLRGFYAPENRLYTSERGVETIEDYLFEECNFGCAYFIVRNQDVQVPRYLNRRRGPSTKERRFSSRNNHHPRVRRLKSGYRSQKM